MFGLACGYADCNDAARLADDPIHKLLVGRDPLDRAGLASQPTLSRFENAVSGRELRDMAHVLADTVIEQQRRRRRGAPRRSPIDLDPTDDPTHGQQEFTFFNGHYDTWCYLPLVATVTFDDEPVQYAVAAVLRPGNAPASRGALGLLRRLFRKLRAAFPAATLRVRLDGGFASPKVFTFLERQQVEYVVAMASNARLAKRARRLMGKARMLSKATGQTAHLYGETRYAARKWKRKRRVIIKAEVVRHPGRDAQEQSPVRGDQPARPAARRCTGCTASAATWRTGSRNCITGWRWTGPVARASWPTSSASCWRWPRTSCSRTCGAAPPARPCADAQVTTLRERLLKLAVWVERSVRRIVLHFPLTFPWLATWRQLARAVGAVPA